MLSFEPPQTPVSKPFKILGVELLVPMTWPVEKSLNNDDEEEQHDPNMIDCYRKYKLGLLQPGVFEVILSLIEPAVRIPYRERSIRDNTMIRLVLYLFRNLAAIPDLNMLLSGTAEQIKMSHMQESLMIRFYESDVIELLLTISSNSTNRQDSSEWNVLVLEILYNLLEHVDPKSVFEYKHETDHKKAELHELSSKLSDLLRSENDRKKQKHTHAPSRHNRFGGTYILEDWEGNRLVSHKQQAGYADLSELVDGEKKENRVGVKRKLADPIKPRKVYQNPRALMYLKATAQSFLESCFNAFFSSILKDMKREDKKIVPKDYTRYYFCMRWFLQYHLYEKKQSRLRKENSLNLPLRREQEEDSGNMLDNKIYDFDLVANAFDMGTILYCLQRIRIKIDDKTWFEVQVTVDCFRQMLASLHEMSQSEEEEYRDAADHIQSNIYYDQSILDLLHSLIKTYRNQSIQYLKTVIMLTHVLLKMLEHYSKTKKTLFIRKKKSKRSSQKKKNKKKELNREEGIEGDIEEDAQMEDTDTRESEEEEEEDENNMTYNEHVFKFESFEKKYISEDIINAYCTLLEGYKDLEPEYIHYITSFFHRMIVKRNAEYLFWKLPVMELFNRIMLHSSKFPRTEAHAQLKELIRYSTRQFFKYASIYPLLFVEALVPSIKTNVSELQTFISKSKPQEQEET
ncbi:hypothetical protein G6F54_006987 [Rhizopus delemar]|nr:hypothetical protein G6F54_006987 [Rhizopus delemar]